MYCDLRIVSIAGLEEVLFPPPLVAIQVYIPSSESVTLTIVRVSVSLPVIRPSSLSDTASLSHEYMMEPSSPSVTLHRNVAFLPIVMFWSEIGAITGITGRRHWLGS